ncbi:MAG: hypothetical protein IPM35_02660 [Myxococcales bacterium]|nr:hypothetical protein [Myxococcales bacterium]
MTINGWDKARLAALVRRSIRTVDRVYLGQGSDFTRRIVTEGARELGLPPPPEPSGGR